MTATITSIAEAIAAAVALAVHGGAPTAVRPLAQVIHWSGELNSIDGVSKAILAKMPAVAVAFDGSVPVDDEDTAVAVTGAREAVHEARFQLLVAVPDVRIPNTGLVSALTKAPGAYLCVQAVLAQVNNLFIADTWRDEPLRVNAVAPYFVQAGVVYVASIQVSARYVLPDAAIPSALAGEITPLDTIAVEINRVGSIEKANDSDTEETALAALNPRAATLDDDLSS